MNFFEAAKCTRWPAVGVLALAVISGRALWAIPSGTGEATDPAAGAPDPAPSVVVAQPAAKNAAAPAWQKTFNRWFTLNEAGYAMRYRSVVSSDGAHEFNQGQERSIIDARFKFDEDGKYAIAWHASSGKYFNWAYADFQGGGNDRAYSLAADKIAAPQHLQQQIFFTVVTCLKENATQNERNYVLEVEYLVAHHVLPAQYLSACSKQDIKDLAASRNSGGWSFYLRRLYFDAKPVKGLDLQYGGLDIDRGAGSEITTYDNDGYIAGERISLNRPDRFFFDQASITYAYLGDLYQPNFFARGTRLAHSNYHQFLVRKNVAHAVDTSFDYTFDAKAHILHEAAIVKTSPIPGVHWIADDVRLESYQRLNTVNVGFVPLSGGNGFAVTIEKKVDRFSIWTGVSDVDGNSCGLTQNGVATFFGLAINGDQYGVYKRYFVRPSYKLTPFIEASVFFSHDFNTTVDPRAVLWNQQALNAGLNFDIKKALFPGKPVH